MLVSAILKLAVIAAALAWGVAIVLRPTRSPLQCVWAIFCTCMAMVLTVEVFGDALGPVSILLSIGAGGTCSVFWLVSRRLFRPDTRIGALEFCMVGAIFTPTLIVQLCELFPIAGLVGTAQLDSSLVALRRGQSLLSSTVLVLAWWEGLRGWSPNLAKPERILRITYLASFGFSVATCTVYLDHGASQVLSAEARALIQAGCAALICSVVSIALLYRSNHPLSKPANAPAPARAVEASDEDRHLARRIEHAVVVDKLFLEPELKLAALARQVNAAEYLVSRAITRGLGEANFNRFINRHRVTHAQTLLSDHDNRQYPVLSIALDSGFASLGPFNRAFKAHTGLTPREYRKARLDGPVSTSAALPGE